MSINPNKFAKCIGAAAAATAASYFQADAAGLSTGHALITALIAGAAIGIVTWGIPNDMAEEVQALAAKAEAGLNTIDRRANMALPPLPQPVSYTTGTAALTEPTPDMEATQVMKAVPNA